MAEMATLKRQRSSSFSKVARRLFHKSLTRLDDITENLDDAAADGVHLTHWRSYHYLASTPPSPGAESDSPPPSPGFLQVPPVRGFRRSVSEDCMLRLGHILETGALLDCNYEESSTDVEVIEMRINGNSVQFCL